MTIGNVDYNNVYNKSDVGSPTLTNNIHTSSNSSTKNAANFKTSEDDFVIFTETSTEPIEVTAEEYEEIAASLKDKHSGRNASDKNVPVHSFATTTSSGNPTLDALYFQQQLLLNEQERLTIQISKKEEQKAKLASKLRSNANMSDNSKNSLKSRISKIESNISSLNSSLSTCTSNLSQIATKIQQTITEALNAQNSETTSSNGASVQAQTSNTTTYTGTGQIPTDLAQRLDNKLGAGFAAKCEDIAAKLKCDVCDFLALMYGESGIDPQCIGYNGAVGLIMFLPDILEANGYSPSVVASMSGVDQLDVVYELLSGSKTNVAGLSEDQVLDTGTLDAICFLPAYAKQEILCSAGDSTSIYYEANSPLDLDGDGNITKTELANRLKSKFNELYEWF